MKFCRVMEVSELVTSLQVNDIGTKAYFLCRIIRWLLNKAQKMVPKFFRITYVMVQVNPTGWKGVSFRESNMVGMSVLRRSCCFFGTV